MVRYLIITWPTFDPVYDKNDFILAPLALNAPPLGLLRAPGRVGTRKLSHPAIQL
jgi:hypothetical protein